MLMLVVMRVQAQSPEVTLPGTSTIVRGTYIPYQESQFIGIDTQFEAYLGLPYAEPPTGDMRFKKPVKKGDLGPLYMANRHRAQCYQSASFQLMSEDCLYLGVYTSSPPVGTCILRKYLFLDNAGCLNYSPDKNVHIIVMMMVVIVMINDDDDDDSDNDMIRAEDDYI